MSDDEKNWVADRLAQRQGKETKLEEFKKLDKLTTKQKLWILSYCEKDPVYVKQFMTDNPELVNRMQKLDTHLYNLIQKKIN